MDPRITLLAIRCDSARCVRFSENMQRNLTLSLSHVFALSLHLSLSPSLPLTQHACQFDKCWRCRIQYYAQINKAHTFAEFYSILSPPKWTQNLHNAPSTLLCLCSSTHWQNVNVRSHYTPVASPPQSIDQRSLRTGFVRHLLVLMHFTFMFAGDLHSDTATLSAGPGEHRKSTLYGTQFVSITTAIGVCAYTHTPYLFRVHRIRANEWRLAFAPALSIYTVYKM